MPDDDAPELLDLMHLARERVIGAWRVGDVLVDPGPASTLDRLLPELERRPVRAIALTHIHLDHAGATGSLLRRQPGLEVWVHERGAPHMIDPSRLLESAGRIYGEELPRLWGEVLPVPAERVRALRGGESLGGLAVHYTPGHASHHVAYMHERSGTLFSGDVAGVRIGSGPVLAPTPPPDIDLGAWRESLRLIRALAPRALAVTHFGVHEDVARHLDELETELAHVEALARELDEHGFAAAMRARLAEHADAPAAESYAQATRPEQNYLGLARYERRVRERSAEREGAGERSAGGGDGR